jgi:hypothetical protein
MADAEDLKSSGDFSSCGFDSHPGHHCFLLKLKEFPSHRRQCTAGVPHPAKVRVGPDSKHAPNQPPIAPVANVPTVRNASR